jgi:hypothetical protein
MAPKSTQTLQPVPGVLPPGISAPDAVLYIKELSQSLSDIAKALGHGRLADLLAEAATEAGRIALHEGDV